MASKSSASASTARKSDLDKYVAENQITWPIIFMDQEGSRAWSNPLVQKYAITSIPGIFLVGRDGKVTSLGARGPELEAAITQLLATPAGPSAAATH